MVPWGYVGGVQCDPDREEAVLPRAIRASLAYSFGMLGCDLHCGYCQNWVTSQALRDPAATLRLAPGVARGPGRDAPLQRGARVIVSTYNEPLITSEWAVEVFRQARAAGLATGFVSNGNGTPEVLDYLRPWVDLYKVDLKGFDDRRYRQLGGRLQPILDTIRRLHDSGIWVEIVTLLVPGFNDSRRGTARPDGVRRGRVARHPLARHGVPRGLPDERHGQHDGRRCCCARPTSAATAGLHFVYAGNLPGSVGDLENTTLPVVRRALDRALRLPRRELPAAAGRRLPVLPARRFPAAGAPRSKAARRGRSAATQPIV